MTIGLRTSLKLPVLVMVAVVLAVACGSDGDGTGTPNGSGLSGTLNIEGSATVSPYTRLAAETFEGLHGGVTVTVGEIGSGAGIAAFISRQAPLAQASRGIRDDELRQAEAAGLDTFETRIFNDALAIVVHPSNTVEQLTLEQVARIYAGDIRNWLEVGGPDRSITLYARNEESGTFGYMEQDIVQAMLGSDAEYDPNINKMPSAAFGLTAVAGHDTGIFYAGLGNVADVPAEAIRVVPIALDEASPAVLATQETVTDGSYPIARGLFYYTDGDPAVSDVPLVTAFIEFVLSPDGQAIGEELGFLPAAGS